tara:strand:- start:162 stop:494 length:333 start_codon:yes stop_codon:yes gene_type:complete
MNEDLIKLIEEHKKEIWEWKQKESQWLSDKNLLAGNKRIIEELSSKMVEMGNKIKELEGTLGSAQDINDNHQRYNGKLQTRLTEVEEDNKKLAKQIQDLTISRKFGDGTH